MFDTTLYLQYSCDQFQMMKMTYKILSKNLHTELQCLKMINDDKMFGVWQMIQSTLCSFKCKELFFYK
jgi:hypothetical protein